jgi:hypothetical protein
MILSTKLPNVIADGAFLVVAASLAGCILQSRSVCDMTPDGSVWLTVVRLTWAEEKFFKVHGRYGELAEMTYLEDGLPPDVTAGHMGSYAIGIELTTQGYVLRATPESPHPRTNLASFYADQTGSITFDRSGRPAGPSSKSLGDDTPSFWFWQ